MPCHTMFKRNAGLHHSTYSSRRDDAFIYRGDGYNSGLYNSGKGIKTEIIPDYDFADDNSGLKI